MPQLQSLNNAAGLRLICPFVKCKIGNDLFSSGDGYLMAASVSLGEGERSSRCNFEIYDPLQKWADQYMTASFNQGGLTGLPSPVNQGAVAGLSGFGGGNSDATAKAIVGECLRQGVTDRAQIAYILATAQHESNMGQLMTEIASGAAYEGRVNDLGNTQPGDGQRFKGRGYVQITGRRNYTRYSELTGVDLVSNPTRAADPDIALYTLVHGMSNGVFTGARLDRYVGGNRRDFRNARRVVNGTDRADLIAGYAQQWLGQIDGLMQGQPTSPPAQPPTTEAPTLIEIADKGAQITIWMGYEPDQLAEFSFIHTGTRFKGMDLSTTTFEGQSVRWTMTRRLKNSTYQNLTLKQLAQRVANAYGLTLQMEADGPTYEHLDQTGISDYALLRRECDRIGYRIYDEGPKLCIEPRKNRPLGFVLEYGVNMDSFEVNDQAQTDQGGGAIASQPTTASTSGELKTTIDPLTGQINEEQPENQGATGTATAGTVATTGAATPPLSPRTTGETDVADGANRDAALRVKGFPGSATFTTTPAALLLTPDTPFITAGHHADFLNRAWAIETVSHDYQQGGLKSSIRFYAPMAPKIGEAIGEAGAGGTVDPASPCAQRLYQAAISMQGFSTANGPGNGNIACVYAVNRVLERAGISNPWGGSDAVAAAEAGLQNGGGTQVAEAASLPGDIVVWKGNGGSHIGIVLASGATQVISNSSSRARFAWVAPNSEMNRYYRVQGRFYRLKC
ncbi:hypothetical protein IQ268_08850 [Oculatella sp. LEGE 06141]|uniref:hypothetical protein n=1 Tax=Oculatella sp. LEGE 06141 TaxID=1828648 RepID=UPI001880702E|nr:hypothetical protein [Oculatella sp. LEGE 06141]MBE9178666.1 hypothetical protein [Oculatella sp. LEGE 06141]